MTTPHADAAPDAPVGAFEGAESFAVAVRGALAEACAAGAGRIVVCDPDFAGWPLGERAVVDALQAWAASPVRGRQMVVIASTYEVLQRWQSLWVAWRRRWDHRVACWQIAEAEVPELPTIAWTPTRVVQRLDAYRQTGVDSGDAQRVVLAREQLDELLRRAAPAFPATTLGL